MKIGIDARLWGQSGLGRYTKNLILELQKIDDQNDYIIFVTKKVSDSYHPSNPRFKKWILDTPIYSLSEQFTILPDLYRAKLDLYHVPHFNVPFFYNRPFVTTIHDLTMLKMDFDATTLSPLMYRFKYYGQKFVLEHAIKKAKKVITPTATVANELILKYRIPENRIQHTYEGVDNDIVKNLPTNEGNLHTRIEKFRIINKYFLYVGNFYNHKNLNTLVVSHKENLANGKTDMQCVFVGKVDVFSQRLAAFVNGLRLNDKFIFASKYVESGFVDDYDLGALYKGAFAFVFPSLSEGFSITPLEAQQIGVPVVISDIAVHREVFGDSALYFNPTSNLDLSQKLIMIERDAGLRQTLIDLGYKNASKYSWTNMAKESLDIYNKCIIKK